MSVVRVFQGAIKNVFIFEYSVREFEYADNGHMGTCECPPYAIA